MKKIALILLLLTQFLFAQRTTVRPQLPPLNRIPLFSEIHVITGDSLNTIYYSYRLPYNQLTFVKDGDNYKAALSFSVEVYDTSGQFISRQMKQSKIKVEDFSETNSPGYYCEDILTFHLPNGEYNFIPMITDVQSGQEAKLDTVDVDKINSDSTETLNPIVLNEDKIDINGEAHFILTNFEDSIPFSSKKYEFAIPCKDTALQKIYVMLINNKDTVFSGYTDKSFLSNLSLKDIDGKILLGNDSDGNIFKIFTLNNFSNSLSEGQVRILISKNKDGANASTFIKNVAWFNKPFSLRNPELAIEWLKYIEADSVISKLLDADKSEYRSVLSKYWEKYDPTPGTKYNELMNEYYNRIDYAFRNFAPLANRNGADTDRGKIYIKYGMPSKIERSSNEGGKVVELWIYMKENMSFKFVDKNGTGDFPLAKG